MSTILVNAQQVPTQYGNEWIRYDLLNPNDPLAPQYFKIMIGKEGIYKITTQDMLDIGIPHTSPNSGQIGIDPRNFQLFYHGEEQHIWVQGGDDGTMNTDDFLVFYGRLGQIEMDSLVYEKPEDQTNPYYSLFTDTAAYFLTWNNEPITKKRIQYYDNTNYTGLTPELYFMDEVVVTNPVKYYEGKLLNDIAAYSEYIEGKGWMDDYFSTTSGKKYEINVKNKYTSSVAGLFETRVYGVNHFTPYTNFNHHINIHFGTNITPYVDDKFESYARRDFEFSIPNSEIVDGNIEVKYSIVQDIGVTTDRNAVSYFKFRYPRTFELNSGTYGKFYIDDNGQAGDIYLEITGYKSGVVAPFLFDFTTHRNIRVVPGTPIKARFPKSGTKKTIIVENKDNFLTPRIKKIDFKGINLDDTYYNYIVICTDSLLPSADNYKVYRSTNAGGGYKPVLITGKQLYNEFSYGEFHPFALRRLAKYFLDKNDSIVHGILLVGFSYEVHARRRTPTDRNYRTTIPPFGNPGSDYMYISNLGGWNRAPSIPLGRLAAMNNNEVRLYLNKVIGFEATSNIGIWSKNMFHLSGGSDVGQQNEFAAYIKSYENVAKGKYFGAKVFSYLKASRDPVLTPNMDSLHKIVNNGVSIITFFGHSSSVIPEINFGYPDGDLSIGDEGYKNKNKYPLMIINGCKAGNAFIGSGSLGQRWLFSDEKGALGYIGHSDFGYGSLLHNYTSLIYKNACIDLYGKTWGEIIQKTTYEYDSIGSGSELFISHARQIVFQGDPVLKFRSPQIPDYQTFDGYLTMYDKDEDGEEIKISATSDSFAVAIIVENLGKAIEDSLQISVKRTFPISMNKDTTYVQTFSPVLNTQTILFWIKSKDVRTRGENTFEIKLDYLDSIKEFNEQNNSAKIIYVMPSDGVNIISPYPYSIVNSPTIKLIAQPNDLLKGIRHYKFEIDTSANFDSPKKQSSPRISEEWLPSWTPDILKLVNNGGILTDSVVYYWRVKVDTTIEEGGVWDQASFVYIKNSPVGWSQSHFPQFSKVKTTTIVPDTIKRKWDYVSTSLSISMRSVGTNNSPNVCRNDLDISPETNVQINNSTVIPFKACCNPGNCFLGFTPKGDFYKDTSIADCYKGMYFFQQVNIVPLYNFISNIPDGHSLINWQYYNHGIQVWPDSLFDVFDPWGVGDSLRAIKQHYIDTDTVLGFLFYAVKGQPDSLIWVKGSTPSSVITLNKQLFSKWDEGTILSEKVGPALKWNTLSFQNKSVESTSTDDYYIDIIGVGNDNVETTLNNYVNIKSDTILNLINADRYPFIRLKMYTSDEANVTPPQLRRWQVTYDGVPEGTLNPFNPLNPNPLGNIDTLDEGEILNYNLAFQNISGLPFRDSILVKYSFIKSDRKEYLQPYRRFAPLPPDSSFYLPGQLTTYGFPGDNVMVVEVNPSNDQPEKYHFNNVLKYNFYVRPDDTPPLLDVVVDGKHIMNGDIVSPEPIIMIKLTDNNKYLMLNDPSKITITFKKPGDTEPQPVSFEGDMLVFRAGTLPDNSAEIEFDPGHLEDGIYELRVQAKDISGNLSGNRESGVSFEVVNESTLSYFYNYPNPFSTSTRFVYTLTGSVEPDYVKIQILTITGKIVREITKEELGKLRIGNNITDFAWDGTDEFGDKLANGVYLYRVIIKNATHQFKHRETGGDHFFKQNWGKMYLLR